MGLVGVGGDRRGAGGGSSTSAAVMAACGGAPAREDDGAAMEGFSKAGRSGGARRSSTGARARGSRRAAACRRRHGSGTSAETRGTHWNEESMSFSESREFDFSLWFSKIMTGSGISPTSGSWRPWEGSAGPDEVWALGGAAQRRVRASRGEQQHAGGGMTRERARKLTERAGTRRA